MDRLASRFKELQEVLLSCLGRISRSDINIETEEKERGPLRSPPLI